MKFIAVVIQIYTRSGQTRLSCSRISLTPQCARGVPRSGTAINQGMTLALERVRRGEFFGRQRDKASELSKLLNRKITEA